MKATIEDLENMLYCYWQQDVKEEGYEGSFKKWMKDNEDEVDTIKEFYGIK